MEYPRILIGTPTYEGKEYCREQFVEHLKNIDYPNFQWCIVDNSKSTRYYSKLNRLYPGHIKRVPRGNNSRDALANASNYLRQKVLTEGYDYLFMLESDVFPPKDVIWRLLRHGRPVVGLPYEIGFGDKRNLCVFVVEQKDNGLFGTRQITKQEASQFLGTGLQRVHGMGVGCTLIHKSILERFAFWYDVGDISRLEGTNITKHPDVYFYLALQNNNIGVYIDTDALCHHQNSNWLDVEDR